MKSLQGAMKIVHQDHSHREQAHSGLRQHHKVHRVQEARGWELMPCHSHVPATEVKVGQLVTAQNVLK